MPTDAEEYERIARELLGWMALPSWVREIRDMGFPDFKWWLDWRFLGPVQKVLAKERGWSFCWDGTAQMYEAHRWDVDEDHQTGVMETELEDAILAAAEVECDAE